MRTAVLAICFFLPTLMAAQSLLIDGRVDDWRFLPVAGTDAAGDAGPSGVDFTQLQLRHDDDWLYLQFPTGAEVVLQEDNTLRLYIDTDNDANTGQQVQGLGAELTWNFSGRSGTVRLGGSTRTIDHADIGLYPAPTYSATAFELALRRDTEIVGQRLFTSDSIRVALAVIEAGGDRIPAEGGIAYGFGDGALAPVSELEIGEKPAHAARLLTWNTLQDGLVDGDRQQSFARVLQAVQPDIMCFQECFDASAGHVLLFVRSVLDPPAGRSWRTMKLDQGNVLITHFDIWDTWLLQGGYRESAYLLGSPEGRDMLLLNCHFRCCGADDDRQREADGVIRFLRDAKTPGGEVTLQTHTPIVPVGDLKLVGDGRQIETRLTGDIDDNAAYGSDARPDWDGGVWTQCASRQPRSRVAHTWYNPRSSYAPSILDYVLYTASVMTVEDHMVINTADMSAQQLQQFSLQSDDTERASDHFPRYADLVWKDDVAVDGVDAPARFAIESAWPQPASSTLQLRLSGVRGSRVRVTLRDLLGRTVLVGDHTSGDIVRVAVGTLPPGTYVLSAEAGQHIDRQLVRVR